MRKISIIGIVLITILWIKTLNAQMCILPQMVDTSANCITLWQPVCGCDGITYSNSCEAQSNGISTWTSGSCPGNGCHASFSSTINTLDVSFRDTSDSTAAPISSWFWDFGDGSTSTVRHPIHTYASPGEYIVSLEIGDMSFVGCQSKQYQVLQLSAASSAPYATNTVFLQNATSSIEDTINNQVQHIWTPEFVDDEGDSIFIHYLSLTNPAAGTVSYDYASGQLIFIPNAGFIGSVGLVLEVCDVNIDCNIYSILLYLKDMTDITEYQNFGFDFEIRGEDYPILFLKSKYNQDILVEYLDLNGKKIYTEKYSIQSGETQLHLEENFNSSGLYMVRITDQKNHTIVKKYVKN